jgi:hypothetical protein
MALLDLFSSLDPISKLLILLQSNIVLPLLINELLFNPVVPLLDQVEFLFPILNVLGLDVFPQLSVSEADVVVPLVLLTHFNINLVFHAAVQDLLLSLQLPFLSHLHVKVGLHLLFTGTFDFFNSFIFLLLLEGILESQHVPHIELLGLFDGVVSLHGASFDILGSGELIGKLTVVTGKGSRLVSLVGRSGWTLTRTFCESLLRRSSDELSSLFGFVSFHD